ncbi:MAG: FAD-dependent oxidoreductase [Microbacteriaceae bacterium]|nr:FAD-dependent oxidoreductase [Microbacteriaceae bacterium]
MGEITCETGEQASEISENTCKTGPKPHLRVAIIGAGPAGIYAADILHRTAENIAVSVDLFERLPAPYGLVRYGVAPDHPRIKGIIGALKEVLDSGSINYFGNVAYGTDITLTDLQKHYNAVIFATGAVQDAPLNIPGIDAAGSYGAADFVNWFDGHPDVPRTWPLEARQIAVVGNGNVALDISRMLIKHADDLLPTEIPDSVYQGLKASPVEEVHVFGRRGPLQVKFTPLELRELGEVRDVDMVLEERDFELTDEYLESLVSNKQVLVMQRIFNKWREEQRAREAGETEAASRRLHLHFWSKPVEVAVDETGRVAGLKIERTEPDGQGGIVGTGEFETVPVQALYRAVGYFGSPLSEVPFDAERGVIPNEAGRVVAGGEALPGVYATGWIKRGPVGLIGATKSDAKETIDALLADFAAGLLWGQGAESVAGGEPGGRALGGIGAADAGAAREPEAGTIERLLQERGVAYTTVAGWHALDQHERALGAAAGRERIKVVSREEMIEISRKNIA